MSRLFLLRHAKAGSAAPGMRDFDRPLDPLGSADAESIGLVMRDGGYVPDLTLCSTVRRARETLAGVAAHADTGRVDFLDELYSTDAAGYLSLIRRTADSRSLLVIGHNPMMEDLAQLLAGAGQPEALAILSSGYPTSGLAVIEASGGLQGLSAETGRLAAFLTRPIGDTRAVHFKAARHCLYRCLVAQQGFPFLATSLTSFTDEARIALDTLSGRAAGLFSPSLRIGVTGLSRAGKTVFISALVHNLVHGGRLPVFEAQKSGRISRAFLEEQPDDAVPRFQYEDHIDALVKGRIWPDSTRAISELRLTIDYESASGWGRLFSSGRLSVDIVDYPGEWLLDLPLLGKSYAEFSRDAFEMAVLPVRSDLSDQWRVLSADIDASSDADEMVARRLAEVFASYLKACKLDERALSTLPPGRFLMPGDLEGSPALTFAPLQNLGDGRAKSGSLHAMMERRYEAYKTHVIKPFFREHIARLDRQIVLIDAMQELNAGAGAMADLERAVTEILACFRPGRGSFLTDLFTRRIDRILIAATKADHLHHESHDRLQAIVRRLADRAIQRADFSGAEVDVLAMAAVRATREGSVKQGRDTLPVIIGTPIEGETIDGERFDGNTETAIFPGDLPRKADAVFEPGADPAPIRFVRFRPPRIEQDAKGLKLSLPHIRLDRAIQFLIGDRLA